MLFVTYQRLKAGLLPLRLLNRDHLVARLFDCGRELPVAGSRDVKKGSALAPVRFEFGGARAGERLGDGHLAMEAGHALDLHFLGGHVPTS